MPTSSVARAAGFTLMEVLLVLAVLALAAAMAAPRLMQLPASSLVAADIDSAAAFLRHARLRAIGANHPVTVKFNIDRRMVATSDRQLTLNAAHAWSLRTGAMLADSDAHGRLVFYPDGSASGGWLQIAHDGRVGHVRVDWLSGRIETHDG